MRYYVVADIHGFYNELVEALNEAGYFNDVTPHKLVVCGDLFDRGKQAKELQSFILDLMKIDIKREIQDNSKFYSKVHQLYQDINKDIIDIVNNFKNFFEGLNTDTCSSEQILNSRGNADTFCGHFNCVLHS